MKTLFRAACLLLALTTFHLSLASAAQAAQPPQASAVQGKVTVNDPQFIPLSEQKSASKGIKWYWYLLGAVLVGGIAAAAGGGGGGGSTPSTGTVTSSW